MGKLMNEKLNTVELKGHIKITEYAYDQDDNLVETNVIEHKNLVLHAMRSVLRDLVFLGITPSVIDAENPNLTINKSVVNLVLASGGLTTSDSLYKWQHPADSVDSGGAGLTVKETDEIDSMMGYVFKVPVKANTDLNQFTFIENYIDPDSLVESPAIRYVFNLAKSEGNGPDGLSQGYVQIGLEACKRTTGVDNFVLVTKAIVPVILKSNTSAITIEYTLIF